MPVRTPVFLSFALWKLMSFSRYEVFSIVNFAIVFLATACQEAHQNYSPQLSLLLLWYGSLWALLAAYYLKYLILKAPKTHLGGNRNRGKFQPVKCGPFGSRREAKLLHVKVIAFLLHLNSGYFGWYQTWFHRSGSNLAISTQVFLNSLLKKECAHVVIRSDYAVCLSVLL